MSRNLPPDLERDLGSSATRRRTAKILRIKQFVAAGYPVSKIAKEMKMDYTHTKRIVMWLQEQPEGESNG